MPLTAFNRILLFSTSLLMGISLLNAAEDSLQICAPCVRECRHHLYVGPEIYYVKRLREGGTRQKGGVFGVKAGYDYLKRYKIYIGGDVLWAYGTLSGESGLGNKIKSRFTDKAIEGRLGYTFQQKDCYRLAFTPFVGGGYAAERNNFIEPSPIPVHFDLHYSFVSVGWLSHASLTSRFDVGINFKAKFIIDAKNHVSHDPDFDSFEMLVKSRTHYRVDLPITYRCSEHFFVALMPFFEYRQYGKHVNFPFDFLETRLRIYGAALRVIYSW